MHILIDDTRDLYGMDIICRNASAGVRACYYFNSDITHLYIDHDLGPGRTGYQVITELLETGYCPPEVQIVSSNPVGIRNIREALLNAGYTMKLDGVNFKRI